MPKGANEGQGLCRSCSKMIGRILSYPQFVRETIAAVMFDEILRIADDAASDWMDQKRGEDTVRVENREALNRSRLRIDAGKWMLPEKYGKRAIDERSGLDGRPSRWKRATPVRLARLRHLSPGLGSL